MLFVIDILASFLLKENFFLATLSLCLFVKMAEGLEHERVKLFARTVFRELIHSGGESVAVDFLEKVFFKPLPKRVFDGFCRDEEFLKWEREFFSKWTREFMPTTLKVVDGFADIVEQSVRIFLFESLKIEGEMTKMKEIIFGRIMVDRWLFAGKAVSVRQRALKYHKRQALRIALRKCQDLEGFTGTRLLCLNSFTSFLDSVLFNLSFFRQIAGSYDGQHVLSRSLFSGSRARFTASDFLQVEKYRKENATSEAIILLLGPSKHPQTARRLFHGLNPTKPRHKHFTMVVRSKVLKLRYLHRCVKKGLNYASLNVCEPNEVVDWHCIFDAYIFLKNVFEYIVCNRLAGILKGFCEALVSPLFQVGFVDVLEKRLISFTLKGKECLIVFGILTCLEQAISDVILT